MDFFSGFVVCDYNLVYDYHCLFGEQGAVQDGTLDYRVGILARNRIFVVSFVW